MNQSRVLFGKNLYTRRLLPGPEQLSSAFSCCYMQRCIALMFWPLEAICKAVCPFLITFSFPSQQPANSHLTHRSSWCLSLQRCDQLVPFFAEVSSNIHSDMLIVCWEMIVVSYRAQYIPMTAPRGVISGAHSSHLFTALPICKLKNLSPSLKHLSSSVLAFPITENEV